MVGENKQYDVVTFGCFRDAQGVLACCNPVPTLVKQYVNEIYLLIMQAKELALTTTKVSIFFSFYWDNSKTPWLCLVYGTVNLT